MKFLLLPVILALCCSVSYAQTATVPVLKENLHIYLLMGQSNMAGRDAREIPAPLENPRVLSLNSKGEWILAREPLHPLTGDRRKVAGVGPGISFALEMLKSNPKITVGLVPCAVGGTALQRWVKGGDLYEKAVERAKIAAPNGVLKGVLWHQGESDTREAKDADSYQARLTQMFTDLRADLNTPDLPIVVGQIGGFLEKKRWPHADSVRAAIKKMPTLVPNVGYADSVGLVDMGDQLHFDAKSQNEFGARYAKAMQKLQIPSIVNIWPEAKMPGRGADQPETEKPSTDGFHRITNVSQPTLTLLPAPNRTTPAPAMVVSPGGGYGHVVMDKEGTEVGAWLNSLGISALVLKYRLPDNRAGAFQDIQRAISLTRAHAKEWNIDPQRLGVIGFSAGGHLSAKASTQFDKRAYSSIDEIDEQSCRPDYAVLVYPAYLDKDGRVSDDLNLKANIPPTLIIHSEDDEKYVVGSKLYHAALDQAKVTNDFKLYGTGGHGYGLHATKEARDWPNYAAQWLQKIGVRDESPQQNPPKNDKP